MCIGGRFSLFDKKDEPGMRIGGILGAAGSLTLTWKTYMLLNKYLTDHSSDGAIPQRTVLSFIFLGIALYATCSGMLIGGFVGGVSSKMLGPKIK